MNRRNFIKATSALGLLPALPIGDLIAKPAAKNTFKVSLSQWAFHRAIFGDSREDYNWFTKMLHSDPDRVLKGNMDPRDIVVQARKLGVDNVDLVNILWFGRAQDTAWINQFKMLANNEGVGFTCLMCDELGQLGSSNINERKKAIENHMPWLDAGARLGCTQLRVNAYGDGSYLAQLQQNAESLHALAEKAKDFGIDILVENHGHPSSNAAWLAMLIEKSAHPNVGAYTDLDNFFMGGWNHVPQRRYDRLQGIIDLAPYTRGVSAKSYDFDKNGEETKVNYLQCFKVLVDAGFNGYACAEYEGDRLGEFEGSAATIKLLKKIKRIL